MRDAPSYYGGADTGARFLTASEVLVRCEAAFILTNRIPLPTERHKDGERSLQVLEGVSSPSVTTAVGRDYRPYILAGAVALIAAVGAWAGAGDDAPPDEPRQSPVALAPPQNCITMSALTCATEISRS
jgi:hypothetical protein